MLPNCESLTYLLPVVVTVLSCYLQVIKCQSVTKIRPESDLFSWSPNDYPSPWKEPIKCGRLLPSMICDPDGLLNRNQIAQIDRMIWGHGRDSVCLCDICSVSGQGITVLIALMKQADVISESTNTTNDGKKLTWTQFADSLRDRFKIGNCDNDVVMVISPYGGGISFGKLSAKLLEKSWVSKLTESDFLKSSGKHFELITNTLDEIYSFNGSSSSLPPFLTSTVQSATTEEPKFYIVSRTRFNNDLPTIKEDDSNSILIAGSSPITSPNEVDTWSSNGYIAAMEDDEFKTPKDNKMSTSLAFIIVGSLTVILISLIALFLIIWYYRTKTGTIEPSMMTIKPHTDEKQTSIDIKSVKYEPCKTDEPGSPV